MNNTAALQKENELLRKQLAANEEKLKNEQVKAAARDAQIAVLNEQLKQPKRYLRINWVYSMRRKKHFLLNCRKTLK